MKVILTQNVKNLGDIGETVKVADGYARNFLLPRKLAVPIQSASAQQLKHERHIIAKREAKLKVELEGQAAQIADVLIEITARAGDSGKLYGSVTTMKIAEALNELGYDVGRRNIDLPEPIKAIGEYGVPIKLGSGVVATAKVKVMPEALEEVAPVDYEEPTIEEAVEAIEAEEAAAEAEAKTADAPAEEAADEAEEAPTE